jgi:hypothetical protein
MDDNHGKKLSKITIDYKGELSESIDDGAPLHQTVCVHGSFAEPLTHEHVTAHLLLLDMEMDKIEQKIMRCPPGVLAYYQTALQILRGINIDLEGL